jgi:hypothetical protein
MKAEIAFAMLAVGSVRRCSPLSARSYSGDAGAPKSGFSKPPRGDKLGSHACRSRPPFPKGRRLHPIDFPIEEIKTAGPRMDFAPANFAAEAA